MLLMLHLLITLLYAPIGKVDCLAVDFKEHKVNSSTNGIIQEFVTVLQQMQNDTSENLRTTAQNLLNMQIATSATIMTTNKNMQAVMSDLSKQIESLNNNNDNNVLRFTNAVENLTSKIVNQKNNELINAYQMMQNQSKILSSVQSSEITLVKETLNNQSTEISSLKEMLGEIKNSSVYTIKEQSNKISSLKENVNETNIELADIRNSSVYTLDEQSMEISLLKESLAASNKVLVELKNSSVYTLEAQSNDILLLKENLNNTNDILAEIRNSTAHLISKLVPTGFTIYNGRTVLLPTALGGTTLSWQDSITRCSNHGAVPFIPRTIDDFKFIQRVNSNINGSNGLWLPANDLASEGVIKWYDDTEASSALRLFEWKHNDGYAGDNSDLYDCVNIWRSKGNKLEMDSCTNTFWPMICEIINSTTHLISRTSNTSLSPVPSIIQNTTSKPVPTGFTKYNDRIVLLPIALNGTTSSWHDSISRCSNHSAVPFIPRTIDDFKYMQRVNSGISGSKGLWLPASDLVTEGTIKWYDGTDASSTLRLFDWKHNNGYAGDNMWGDDCVNIWTNYNNTLQLERCNETYIWNMICEIV